MTAVGPSIELSQLAWTVKDGGFDGAIEDRRIQQLEFLDSFYDVDLLWNTEGAGWHEGRRITDVESHTGLTALPPVTSRGGDGRNRSIMLHNSDKITPNGPHAELARGASCHGVSRKVFDLDGIPLPVLGTHLSFDSGPAVGRGPLPGRLRRSGSAGASRGSRRAGAVYAAGQGHFVCPDTEGARSTVKTTRRPGGDT